MKTRKLRRYGLLGLALLLVAAAGLTLYYGFRPLPQGVPDEAPVVPTPGTEAPKPPPGELAESACVTCHRTLPRTFIGHTFADWEDSLHAQQGVSCSDCHGGDPTQAQLERAHQGLRPSRDPQSPLYFTKVPQTCGRCHTAELAYFQQSVHYQQLQETGRGPNCVTCHGAMAIAILSPQELAATCTACHNERLGIRPDEPLKARFLLTLIRQAQGQLELIRKLISAKQEEVNTRSATQLLAQAEAEMRAIQEGWHTFRLEQVESQLEQVLALAQAAVEALEKES